VSLHRLACGTQRPFSSAFINFSKLGIPRTITTLCVGGFVLGLSLAGVRTTTFEVRISPVAEFLITTLTRLDLPSVASYLPFSNSAPSRSGGHWTPSMQSRSASSLLYGFGSLAFPNGAKIRMRSAR